MNHRLISNLCWIVSGLGIAAALAWIAVAEDKGTAILGGLAAVILARVLVGEVARWHEERDVEKRREEESGSSESGSGTDNQ
ncbi:MAG: hypothetical protein GY895_05560 [Phycisphaera sp.]|nr:hypothetical protein [Phycisphaera sp.]